MKNKIFLSFLELKHSATGTNVIDILEKQRQKPKRGIIFASKQAIV